MPPEFRPVRRRQDGGNAHLGIVPRTQRLPSEKLPLSCLAGGHSRWAEKVDGLAQKMVWNYREAPGDVVCV